MKEEKAQGVKNVTHTGTGCGASKDLLLTLRDIEGSDRVDGLELLVLASRQR